MNTVALAQDILRESILAQPDLVLDDPHLMRALIEANERTMGSNIVDLRGIAMKRLEDQLGRLEDTHRTVIAAAYENLAGTNQIHRAILRMLEPTRFEDFVLDLAGEVADILRVDTVRLVLESAETPVDPALRDLSKVLKVHQPGFIDAYLEGGREGAIRKVSLRQTQAGDPAVYGTEGAWIRSEACLRLHLGPDRLPGLLCLGAEDPHLFTPSQGTDLLVFFTGAVERAIRRWLS